MGNTDSIIAVYEPRPYWGPELQRQFLGSSIAIREYRALNDLIPSIAPFPRAILVIDFHEMLHDCLSWLTANFRNPLLDCPKIACGSKESDDLEWFVRDLGVTAFLPDVIPGDDFAHLCRRLLNRSSIRPH